MQSKASLEPMLESLLDEFLSEQEFLWKSYKESSYVGWRARDKLGRSLENAIFDIGCRLPVEFSQESFSAITNLRFIKPAN
jgi:hypothetical protein